MRTYCMCKCQAACNQEIHRSWQTATLVATWNTWPRPRGSPVDAWSHRRAGQLRRARHRQRKMMDQDIRSFAEQMPVITTTELRQDSRGHPAKTLQESSHSGGAVGECRPNRFSSLPHEQSSMERNRRELHRHRRREDSAQTPLRLSTQDAGHKSSIVAEPPNPFRALLT